jgi:hypothetical protein
LFAAVGTKSEPQTIEHGQALTQIVLFFFSWDRIAEA